MELIYHPANGCHLNRTNITVLVYDTITLDILPCIEKLFCEKQNCKLITALKLLVIFEYFFGRIEASGVAILPMLVLLKHEMRYSYN